jgi:hypothetical protein
MNSSFIYLSIFCSQVLAMYAIHQIIWLYLTYRLGIIDPWRCGGVCLFVTNFSKLDGTLNVILQYQRIVPYLLIRFLFGWMVNHLIFHETRFFICWKIWVILCHPRKYIFDVNAQTSQNMQASQNILFVRLFVIFHHTQQSFSYMMVVSFYWWKREPRYIIQYLWRDHRPSTSKLTNFLTQSHRYEQDSNRRGLEVKCLVVLTTRPRRPLSQK